MPIFISPKFENIIRKKGFSKGDLAHELSVTAQHLSRIINNRVPVGIKTQKRIIKVFAGYSWERIFKIEENTNV